jgi:hypothetical protein
MLHFAESRLEKSRQALVFEVGGVMEEMVGIEWVLALLGGERGDIAHCSSV